MPISRFRRYRFWIGVGLSLSLGAGIYSAYVLSESSWAQGSSPDSTPTPPSTPAPATPPAPAPSDTPVAVGPELLQAEVDAIRAEIGQLLTRLVILESQLQALTRAGVTTNPVAEIARSPQPQTPQPQTTESPTPPPVSPPPASPDDPDSPTPEPPTPTPEPPDPPPVSPNPIPGTPAPEPTPTPESTPISIGTQTISLPGDVLFDFDRAIIRPEAESLLDAVVEQLQDLPEARVIVEGHTDNIGDNDYNQALSSRRAEAVRDYLVQQLSDTQNRWETAGLGASRPVADNSTAEGRQQNRRVDITIAP